MKTKLTNEHSSKNDDKRGEIYFGRLNRGSYGNEADK